MKARLLVFGITFLGLLVVYFTQLSSRPSFNGTTPGCGSGGGCHTRQAGIVSLSTPGGLNVEVTLIGVTPGNNVAGEVVNSSGVVVNVVDMTSNNPFTLSVPSEGTYVVNAGYKQPSRLWDSVRVTIVSTSVGETSSGTAPGYLLTQNFPNPFNATTSIRYRIPNSHHVTITLYDILGQNVGTLIDDQQRAGDHKITIDGQNFVSGVYFYRIEAGQFVQTKKLVLLK